MIKLQNLSKREGKKTIFEDVNCEIKEGEIIGILGKSGSGKTILLDMIIGLKRPNTGNILIDDKDIFEDIFETRRKIGYMSETPIYKEMLVGEYLRFLTKIRNKKEQDEIVKKHLEAFSLEDVQNTLVGNLSKSENIKIAIAGAYVANPKIILLDEPFKGLEVIDVANTIKFIKETKNKFTTIITSNSGEYLEDICDKVFIVNQGHIVNEVDIKKIKKEKKALKSIFIESINKKEKK